MLQKGCECREGLVETFERRSSRMEPSKQSRVEMEQRFSALLQLSFLALKIEVNKKLIQFY